MFHTITELRSPITALPDVIRDSAAQLKAYFDDDPSQLMEEHNRLIEDLRSYRPGESGAAEIGSEPISGVKGTTIRGQLQDLKEQLDLAAMGSLPNGTVTAEKLAEGAALANLQEGTIAEPLLQEILQQMLHHPGDLKWSAAAVAPAGWLLCNGETYMKAEYPLLYEAIGDTFSDDDTPINCFKVPDLRGRVLVGMDDTVGEFNMMGKTGGEIEHILTKEEMPSHGHKQVFSASATAVRSGDGYGRSPLSNNMTTISEASAVSAAGGGRAHNNLQPYMALQCYIKW